MRADLITLSREYGAGAGELAQRLGESLGWPVLDSGIPLAVAERLGIPEDSLDEWDEHAPNFLESIGNALLLGSPEIMIDPAYVRRPAAREVADVTRQVLLDRTASPPLIVVGHGAQVLLADRPRTLHLRLVAPLEVRARRVMERRQCSEQEAFAICDSVDRDRVHYVQQFLRLDVRDPLLYAMQINTGVVSMDDAVRLVSALLADDRE
jgi:cytidylate kinase